MPNQNSRLAALEERAKVLENGGVWIDMLDNKVRVDIGIKHGKELTFPTVFEAGQYVQAWKDKSGTITGVAFISFFPDLMYKKPLTEVSDKRLKDSAVLINLSKWTNGNFEDIVLASWAHGHMDPADNPFILPQAEHVIETQYT
jgi:hypothetical protein